MTYNLGMKNAHTLSRVTGIKNFRNSTRKTNEGRANNLLLLFWDTLLNYTM